MPDHIVVKPDGTLVENCLVKYDKGIVEVRFFRMNEYLVVTIKDNGRGIPESERSKIFDLYYTTRIDGTGLGLAITQKIILQHKGAIDFYSTKDETIFKIKIPLK